MARAAVIGAVGVIETFHGFVGDVLQECGKMVPNERRDPPELETAGVVVHDEAQQRQENVFGDGRAVYAGVTGDGAHRRMREAMNESVDESPDRQGPDVIQEAVMFYGLERSDDAGDARKFRIGKRDAICLEPTNDEVGTQREKYAFMLAFAGENRNRADEIRTAQGLRCEFLNGREGAYFDREVSSVEFLVGRFEVTPRVSVGCGDHRQVVNVQDFVQSQRSFQSLDFGNERLDLFFDGHRGHRAAKTQGSL